VVSRCRANYQQQQWDEGARFLGLFSAEEWALGISVAKMDQSTANRRHRLRLVEVRSYIQPPPDALVVQCFVAAFERGDRSPNCMRDTLLRRNGAGDSSVVDDYFQYASAAGNRFADIDACRSFSGGDTPFGVGSLAFSKGGASMPLFIWTGSSGNKDHVATPHLVQVLALDFAPRRCALYEL